MTDYPNPARLIHSLDFRLHPTFEGHPTEPNGPKTFTPVEYIHRLLTVRPKQSYDSTAGLGSGGTLDFEFKVKTLTPSRGPNGEGTPFEGTGSPEAQVQAFIKDKIGKGVDFDALPLGILGTPFDIPVKHQCFIILELDRKLSWQFAGNSPGVSTKEFYGTDNFGLIYRTDESQNTYSDPAETSIKGDGRKVLYFRVGRRRWDMQKLNFHIEFEWAPGKYMPLIFDPNVPDNGGASFP